MRDMLRETWAYQEIKQEGLDEGLQKGRPVALTNLVRGSIIIS